MSFVPGQELQMTAYKELLAAQLDPEIQISAEYNTTGQVSLLATGTSSAGATGGEFFATSGTGAFDVGAIFSKGQIIPRHGQGSLFRFSARFDAGLADARSTVGGATASDAVVFGYEGVEFGVFYTHDGAVVVYELEITGAAGGAENATITIDGTGYTVPLTAGTVQHNAFEIAESLNSQVALYNFSQNDDVVVLRSLFAAPETGAFTFSSSTATGTFTQTAAGVEPTREFTAQADWNQNTKPDLDPTKTNYYSIRHNGDIEYYVQDEATSEDVLVHREGLPNTLSRPIFGNASFRMVWSISNLGNTTPLSVMGAHGSAFIEGFKKIRLPTHSAESDATSVGITLINIATIRNRIVFGTKVNLGRIIPSVVSAFSEGAKGTEIAVFLNADVAGDTDFSYINESESIAEIDTTPGAVTGGELLVSKVFANQTEINLFAFNDIIQSGNSLTIAMRVIQLPAADMGGAGVWEEEF